MACTGTGPPNGLAGRQGVGDKPGRFGQEARLLKSVQSGSRLLASIERRSCLGVELQMRQ